MNEDKKFEIIKFIDEDFSLDVKISPYDETVWLSKDDISKLYERDRSVITKHISLIYKENELKEASTCAKFAQVQIEGEREIKRNKNYYNLDMILAVGYRIKSKRTSKFREWALSEIDKLNNINNQKALISQYILFNYDEIKLNVNVDPNEDTVWLNKEQLITLFDTTRQNLEYHINNIYSQNELEECSTCKKILQVQIENNREVTRPTNLYNLDMIISLGYRINSKRGIIFRKWATKILKQYLLKGYVINEERCLNCNSSVLSLNNRVTELEEKMKDMKNDIYLEKSKAFYEGEIVEPYTFLRHIFFLAKKELIITDYYADNYLISMLKDININITIITSSNSYLNKVDIPNNINIIYDDNMHGRYIFIDDRYAYVIDNSFNSIGKKKFVIVKLENINKEMLLNKERITN